MLSYARDAYLALSNGVHPAGRMLLSIKVSKKTVVARSFQGRPGYCIFTFCDMSVR